MNKISVVSVNYNGYEDTCEMIESLRKHISTPYEIIVVDNASRRDEAAMLKVRFPEITALRSEVNLGFAGGNNLGIGHATGKYILLLNNDTLIEDDTLHLLAERLDSDERIGVVSPKIRFAFPPSHIQFAGYTPLSSITLRNALVGFDMPDDGSYDKPARTPYAHGAAMLFRREVIERAGPMSELYFLYYEELDWCTKIADTGYELWYDPRCTVFHKESRSTGQQSPLRVRYITRNRLLYAWRNRKGATRYASLFYLLTAAPAKNILSFLAKGQVDLALAVCKGSMEFFTIKHKLS